MISRAAPHTKNAKYWTTCRNCGQALCRMGTEAANGEDWWHLTFAVTDDGRVTTTGFTENCQSGHGL